MTIFGYIRENHPESTDKQLVKISQQLCDVIYIEDKDCQIHEKRNMMIKAMTKEDIVVVADLQVFGMGMRELDEFNQTLKAKKVQLISINDQVDTRYKMTFFDSVQLFIKLESEQKSYHTKARLAVAKAEGKQLGRPRIKSQQIKRIKSLSNTMMPMREIAEQCDVSLGTVHKYVNQQEPRQKEKQES